MTKGRRFAAVLSAVIAAVAVVLIAPGPARAGGSCDLNDIWNALQNTVSTISSASCAGVTADPALWAPVGVAAGVMAGVSQSQQFCQDVKNAQNQLTNLQGGGSGLVTQLGNLGVDASFLSSILDAMSSAADALAIVQCACGLSNNITQVGGDLGACVADALCDLQNLANQIDPCAVSVLHRSHHQRSDQLHAESMQRQRHLRSESRQRHPEMPSPAMTGRRSRKPTIQTATGRWSARPLAPTLPATFR